MHAASLHTLFSVQNICLYLTHFLTQRLLESKHLALTMDFNLCVLTCDQLADDEHSVFIELSHLYVNNLMYLHLSHFKKVSSLSELHISSLFKDFNVLLCFIVVRRVLALASWTPLAADR